MSRPVKQRNILYGLCCLFMFVGSIAAEIFTVRAFLEAQAVESWPTTKGKVLRSELESTLAGLDYSYTAHVEYDFKVSGQAYRSSSVRTRGTSTKHQSDAKAVVEKFPVGSDCTVFYKEDAPDVSYLEAGVGIVNYVIIVSPVVFAVLFGTMAWELLVRR